MPGWLGSLGPFGSSGSANCWRALVLISFVGKAYAETLAALIAGFLEAAPETSEALASFATLFLQEEGIREG